MATETSISKLHGSVASDSPPDEMERHGSVRGEHSLLDLLVILADHKRLIIWITATFTLLAIPLAFLLPNRYTATVTVMPPQQNSAIGSMLASQLSGLGESSGLSNLGGMAALAGSGLGLKNPNDRYVGMLRSRIVEDAVIQQFGLQQEYHKKYLSDARKKFETRADVNGSGKDGLIHISIEDNDPRRATEIANGYVNAFRRLSDNLALTEASQRRIFFEQQLDKAKDNLASAEEAMKRTQESTGLIQLDSQARALIETVATLRAQITTREMMIQGLQTYATNQNSQYVQAQQELDSLRAELAKLGGSESSKDGMIVPKGLVPQASLEYMRKLRDVKYYEAIFEVLARQYELARLDEAREGAIIQIVDPATIPDKRSFPKRSYIILGAFFGGFIIAVLSAFTLSALHRMEADPATAMKVHQLRKIFSWNLRRN